MCDQVWHTFFWNLVFVMKEISHDCRLENEEEERKQEQEQEAYEQKLLESGRKTVESYHSSSASSNTL